MKIRLFVTGRGYHHASSLPPEIEVPHDAKLHDALAVVQSLLADAAPLSASALVALGGEHVGTVRQFDNRTLRDGDELTIIAPVAGG
jgi:molybdopterin converting factor small subunit